MGHGQQTQTMPEGKPQRGSSLRAERDGRRSWVQRGAAEGVACDRPLRRVSCVLSAVADLPPLMLCFCVLSSSPGVAARAGCEQADLAVTCRARVGQGRMSDTEFVTLVIRAHLVDIEHLSVPVVRALHFLLVACRSLEPPLLLPQVSRLDAPEWWSFRCRRRALSL